MINIIVKGVLLILLLTIGGSLIYNLLTIKVLKPSSKKVEVKGQCESKKNNKYDIFQTYSAWIGFFERLIIYGTILTQNYIFLSVLITLKGIIRFPEIAKNSNNDDSKITAEKFIFGTLFSIIYTVIIYCIFKNL